MIKFHHLFRLVFGFCMVELCTFFYYLNYYSGPSYSRLNPAGTSISAENQKLLGITPSSKYTGLYQLGDQNLYLSGNKIWQQDQSGNYYLEPLGTNTRFKQYTGDVAGFNKSGSDDSTVYDVSPAYLYSKRMAGQEYTPFSAQQAPLQAMGYNPALGLTQGNGIYSPAVGNLLSAPTAMTAPTGNYGAGRFMNNGLLGLNFGLNNYANGVSRYSPTIEALSNNSNIVNLGNTAYDLSKAQGNVIQGDGKLTFGNIADIFRTVQPNPVTNSNGQQYYGNIMEAAGAAAQNLGINNE